jgi:hypothetical protein
MSDYQDEDISFYSQGGEYLEDLFTLRDYLEVKSTRSILEENHYEMIETQLVPKIKIICDTLKETIKDTRILHRDTRGLFFCELVNLIIKHIKKKYNLEVFYENPSLASDVIIKYKTNNKITNENN